MKRIEIEGTYYRIRKGRLVEIPEKWVGQLTHPQSIRKRQSKYIRKIKRYMQAQRKHHFHNYHELKYGMLDGVK